MWDAETTPYGTARHARHRTALPPTVYHHGASPLESVIYLPSLVFPCYLCYFLCIRFFVFLSFLLSFVFFLCIWFAGVRTPVVSSTMTWHFTVYTPFTPLRCTRYLVAFLCRSFVITELASLLGSRTSTDTGKGVLDVEGYYRKKTA